MVSFWTRIILSILNAGVCVVGDELVKLNKNSLIRRAICDNMTHALSGLLISLIIILELKRGIFLNEKLCLIGFGCIISSFIDFDHFLAAKSIRLSNAVQLSERPPLHCTTIPLLLLLIQIFNGYFHHSYRINLWLSILICAFLSHHIRDANRRGFWIFPFGHTKPLPFVLYILFIMFVPNVTILILDLITRHSILVVRQDALQSEII